MANFSFTVDTREMAEGLYSVAPHVDETTGAVVSMQTSVIMAEKHAAETVCGNVNRGFFSLIRSQISQKIAICRSQVEARLLELRDESQKLLAVKATMQRDYQMITTRYSKLFRTLDLALLSRIHELDTLVLDLVQKDIARQKNRTRTLQASFPVNQMESVASCQIIAASATRAKVSRVIDAMSRFIQESNQQDRLTVSILSTESGRKDASVLLPIALVECDSFQTRQKQWKYHSPAIPVPEVALQVKRSIELDVFRLLSRVEWRQQKAKDHEIVARCLHELMEQAHLNDRVRAHMIRMYVETQSLAIAGVQP